MALGFRSREVSALKDGSLSDLNPLASVREFGEGGRERRGSLASNLDTVNLLAVLAWSSDDGSHVLCLPWVRVTLLEQSEQIAPHMHHGTGVSRESPTSSGADRLKLVIYTYRHGLADLFH